MAHENRVIVSINEGGGILCVDIVQTPGGQYGFQQCRRDPEDSHGWRIIGPYSAFEYQNAQAAWDAACAVILWLDDVPLPGAVSRP